MSNITTTGQQPNTSISVFNDPNAFEHAQRICRMLSSSELVPAQYRGNMANTLVAYSMAVRMNADPLMIMQNLHVIEGRPSWSAPFIAAAIRSSGRFRSFKLKMDDLGPWKGTVTKWRKSGESYTEEVSIQNKSCYAVAIDNDGEEVRGPLVTIEMAVREGWYSRKGSKWQTMPELMLQYRAASFFGRLHAGDILMGMHTDEEVYDAREAETIDGEAIDLGKVSPTVDAKASINQLNSAIDTDTAETPKRKRRAAPVDEAVRPAPAAEEVENNANANDDDDLDI